MAPHALVELRGERDLSGAQLLRQGLEEADGTEHLIAELSVTRLGSLLPSVEAVDAAEELLLNAPPRAT